MKLKQFFVRPGRFRNRETIPISNVQYLGRNDNIFEFVVSNPKKNTSYTCSIYIDDKMNVKFDCTCDSFKYQFAAILSYRNALLYPEKYSKKLPRNIAIAYICKHLEACINFLKSRGLIY